MWTFNPKMWTMYKYFTFGETMIGKKKEEAVFSAISQTYLINF